MAFREPSKKVYFLCTMIIQKMQQPPAINTNFALKFVLHVARFLSFWCLCSVSNPWWIFGVFQPDMEDKIMNILNPIGCSSCRILKIWFVVSFYFYMDDLTILLVGYLLIRYYSRQNCGKIKRFLCIRKNVFWHF